MARPWGDRQKDLLCPALDQIIDLGHPLVQLADAIDWRFLDGRDSGEPIGDAQDRRHRDEGSPDHGCVRPERRPSDAVRYSGCPADLRRRTHIDDEGRCDGQNYRQTRRRVRRPIRRIGPTASPTAGNRSLSRILWFHNSRARRRWSLISPEPRLRLYSRSGARKAGSASPHRLRLPHCVTK